MSKITLEQWRVLHTVVDAGGFTQAAEVLHKSQSSISYSVTKLQQQLGFPILEMEGRKAKLTDRGLILLEHSRALLQQSEQLENLANALNQNWGDELHIYISPSVPYSLLLHAITEFKRVSPGTRLSFSEELVSQVKPESYSSNTSIKLTTNASESDISVSILTLEMVAVVSSTHKLAFQSDGVCSADLKRERQIVIDSHLMSDDAFQVANIPAAIAMVESGMGYAYLPLCEVESELVSSKLCSLNLINDSILSCPVYAHIENPEGQNNSAELFINILKS